MVVDSPESAAPTTPATPAVEGKAMYVQSLSMCPCSFLYVTWYFSLILFGPYYLMP
jgi:hypothetical protein